MRTITLLNFEAQLITYKLTCDNWYQLTEQPLGISFPQRLRYNRVFSKFINASHCFELPERNEKGQKKMFTGLQDTKTAGVFTGNKKESNGKVSDSYFLFSDDRQKLLVFYFRNFSTKGKLKTRLTNEISMWYKRNAPKIFGALALFKNQISQGELFQND